MVSIRYGRHCEAFWDDIESCKEACVQTKRVGAVVCFWYEWHCKAFCDVIEALKDAGVQTKSVGG